MKMKIYVTQVIGHSLICLFKAKKKKTRNCAKSPITCSLIETIPEVRNNRRGQVKFSVMKSGTHVHPHSGPTNCRLRAHLGLQIPPPPPQTVVKKESNIVENSRENKAKLRVADQYLSWKNGELFIFDDSFYHEVWYESESKNPRLILIIDLWHPDLSEEKRKTIP